MGLVRRGFGHHFRDRLVVRQLVSHNLMGHFEFRFVLEFIFLLEFVFAFTFQSRGCDGSQLAAKGTSDGGAHNWSGYLCHLLENGKSFLEKASEREIFRLIFQFGFVFALAQQASGYVA